MIQSILTYNSEVCVPLLNQILRSWNDSGIEKTPLKFRKRYLEVLNTSRPMRMYSRTWQI